MNKLLTHLLCALLLAGLLPRLAYAQPNQIGNANGTFLCPGKTYTFSSSNASGTTNCQVSYAVTGGDPVPPVPTTAGNFQVQFRDTPGGSATVQAVYAKCTNVRADGSSPVLTVYIRSITNQPLGALTLNGNPLPTS